MLLPLGFDLFLRDTTSWPCNVLSDTLHLPSVEVLPLPLVPISAQRQGYPNNPAYIPQLGTDFTPEMVSNIIQLDTDFKPNKRHGSEAQKNVHKGLACSCASCIMLHDACIVFASPISTACARVC